jgi:hypothetical protein
MIIEQIEDLINPVAKQMPFCADTILDLRTALINGQHPGKCVACFFKILAPACRIEKVNAVAPLKDWLEKNLEIVVKDDSTLELERLSVNLLEDDLETFCQKVMMQIHYDRNYANRQLSLHFAYKESKAA